jgi:hypothetical protein
MTHNHNTNRCSSLTTVERLLVCEGDAAGSTETYYQWGHRR